MLRSITIILIALVLTACGRNIFLPKNPFPAPVETEIEQVLEAVLSKNVDRILSKSSPEFRAIENAEEALEQIIQYLPAGDLESELVIARTNQSDNSKSAYPVYTAIYEITDGDKYALTVLSIEDSGECCALRNIKFSRYESSPSRANDFIWSGKPIRNYVFIFVAALIPIFIIISLVSCWRNKKVEKKWRWRLFVAFGLYGLSLNWTTNAITPNFISINTDANSFHLSLIQLHLFGAGFTKSGIFEPWIIETGFPLGAILYWWKSKRGKFMFTPNAPAVPNPLISTTTD